MVFKIAIIGGGSSIFTPQLISLFIKSKVFQGSAVTLMDIDEQRLELMDTLCNKLISTTGARLKVESTTDRRKAVTGANYVITAISVGGFDAWEKDLEIPAKYGIYQPIGDSVGPGGIMRAFRHVLPLVELCQDLETVAPDALVFNYTNPVPALCWAMRQQSTINVIGICTNGVYVRDPDFIATWVGTTPEELMLPPPAGGINHCAAILKLRFKDGRDAFPRVREEIDHPIIRWGLDMYGILPYAWPHWMEFFPSLCRLETEYTGRLQGLCMRYGHPVHDMEVESSRVTQWEELVSKWLSGEENISLESIPMFEIVQVVEVMASMIEDRNEVHVLNVPNRGAIDNLPYEYIVEVSTGIDGYGIRPIHVGPLPEALAAHLRLHIDVQKITVEAALTGSRTRALQAFMLDPFVSSTLTIEDTERLMNEMLAAHAAYLPQFL
jgi:alpha-galactosidase